MSLLALFMSICLHTDLACEDIEIEYSKLDAPKVRNTNAITLPPIVKGRATLFADGRQLIEINERMESWNEWQRRDVVMHEIAHMVVWHSHPDARIPAHGREFRHACYDIARAIGVPTKKCRHNN